MLVRDLVRVMETIAPPTLQNSVKIVAWSITPQTTINPADHTR